MDAGVQLQRLLEQGQDVLLVVRQREVLERRVGFSGGRGAGPRGLLAEVVERVEGDGEIGRAKGLAQEADGDALLAAEEHLQCLFGLRGR